MSTVASRQDELKTFYANTFGADWRREPPKIDQKNPPLDVQLTDDEILNRASGAKGNGFLFTDLWEDRWQDYSDRYGSQSEADSALCMILAFWTRDPEQIDRLFRQSALYRPKWDEQHGDQTYGAMTITRALEKQTEHYDPNYGQAKRLTDLGNAARLARMAKGRAMFCPQLKSWFFYSEGRWKRDELGEIKKLAAECVRSIYGEAATATDADERKALAGHAHRSESLSRMKAMIELAQPLLAVSVKSLDSDPWKFNVLNGTIDLKTGRLLPHDSADLMTKQAPVVYDPGADCRRFKQFLDEIFPDAVLGGGNEQILKFVQKFLGYCMVGDTREQIMAIAWGTGANGKSTLFNLVQEILGDYAMTTPAETLLVKRGESISNDLARLRGARFVLASETVEGRRMNVALVKQITGQDQITARFLHCEYFSFIPEFKLVLLTNHKPAASGDDYAFWRRIRLIPFEMKFEGNARDDTLTEKLRQESAGILAWMVEGCLLWQKEGLTPPAEVTRATQDYRSENDIFSEWLDECCEEGGEESSQTVRTKTADLFQSFKGWLAETGARCLFSRRKFTEALKEKGFEAGMNRNGDRCIIGLKLKPQVADEFDELLGS